MNDEILGSGIGAQVPPPLPPAAMASNVHYIQPGMGAGTGNNGPAIHKKHGTNNLRLEFDVHIPGTSKDKKSTKKGLRPVTVIQEPLSIQHPPPTGPPPMSLPPLNQPPMTAPLPTTGHAIAANLPL